jgi:hypothetical protein
MVSAFLWGGAADAALRVGYALAGRGLCDRTIGIVMGIGAGALINFRVPAPIVDEASTSLATNIRGG